MYLINMFQIYNNCKWLGYISITQTIREISEIFLLNSKRYNIFTEKSINNKTELCKSKLVS